MSVLETSKNRGQTALKVLQIAFVIETGIIAMLGLPGLFIAGFLLLQGLSTPGSKYEGGPGLLMLLFTIGFMFLLALAHLVTLLKATSRGILSILWAATLMQTFFWIATLVVLTGDLPSFIQKTHGIFIALFAFNIFICIAGLILIATNARNSTKSA
jgi:hypothetical protein